jgi:HPt (histidine-containing phosphotransfer) domain-containing protein
MDDKPDMQAEVSPVSMELLEEYTGGDREFLIELTDQFWADLEDRLPSLRRSASPFDGALMKDVAHAIAGAATCVGAEVLREKALALENCGRSSHVHLAPALLLAFETELQRVRDFFADYLR